MQFVLVFARNGPEPENAPIVAFAFQSGNGPVMLLVAPARTIFFVEQRRARGRQGGIRSMRRGKQVERPVEKRQGGHCLYPFKVVTKPLWRAIPLTQTATFSFRSGKPFVLHRTPFVSTAFRT
jgi:hypothetical protein